MQNKYAIVNFTNDINEYLLKNKKYLYVIKYAYEN